MNQSNTSKKNDALSKSDIVSLIAEGMTLSKVDVEHVVDKLFSVMANEMAQKRMSVFMVLVCLAHKKE